ncbi:hypothetical protein [Streptomyces sp. TR06-5]|uniref:hypothetical protein n=1 Tax=Streptomyces sp. TR06-5 TaxID=3385976 RepID=UPI00399F7F02
MTLRRARNTTAWAALFVAAGLTAAPAALAAGGGDGAGSPAPVPSTSPGATPAPTGTVSGSPLATPPPSAASTAPPTTLRPSATASSPAAPADPPESDPAPPADDSSPPEASGTPTAATTSPGSPAATAGSDSPEPSTSGSPDRDRPNDLCGVADFDVRVTGLPATVGAGTTSEPFTVVLDNTAGEDAAHVQFGMAVALRDGSDESDWTRARRHVAVHYFDRNDERWRAASAPGGVYTYTDIEAGRRYEMLLRLELAPDTPPGGAGALAFSTLWKFDPGTRTSDCVYDNEWYRFEITGNGPAPRATAAARPQGATAPQLLRREARRARPVPQTDGALAATGTSPLRTLVPVGVAAVTLGAAAVVYGARRRT